MQTGDPDSQTAGGWTKHLGREKGGRQRTERIERAKGEERGERREERGERGEERGKRREDGDS